MAHSIAQWPLALALTMALGTGVAGSLTASHAEAQEWPTKPITMVVPFNAGGSTDMLARSLASFLPDELGQPVTVVNRPGAGGQIGITWFLQQPPDGHTLLVTAAAPYIPINILVTGADYTLDDFVFVNSQWIDYTIVAVPNESPYESLEELIEAVKANPGELSTGVTYGSAGHLNTMVLLDALEIPAEDVRIVTFDGGAQARTALASGQVDFGIDQGEGLLPFSDSVRPLAVFLEEPVEDWDAPLINDVLESYDAEVPILNGAVRTLVVPAEFEQNNPEGYQKLIDAYQKVLASEGYQSYAEKTNIDTAWRGPEASTQIVEDNFAVMEQYQGLLKN